MTNLVIRDFFQLASVNVDIKYNISCKGENPFLLYIFTLFCNDLAPIHSKTVDGKNFIPNKSRLQNHRFKSEFLFL